MNDNYLKEFKKILQETIRPLKETVEIAESKISKVEAKQGVMYYDLQKVKDQQSVMNEKIDSLDEKVENGFENLDEKIEEVGKNVLQVLKYASNIEDERDKNEKRIKKIETKIGLVN